MMSETELGKWSIEDTFDKAYFVQANRWCGRNTDGEWTFKMSGVPTVTPKTVEMYQWMLEHPNQGYRHFIDDQETRTTPYVYSGLEVSRHGDVMLIPKAATVVFEGDYSKIHPDADSRRRAVELYSS